MQIDAWRLLIFAMTGHGVGKSLTEFTGTLWSFKAPHFENPPQAPTEVFLLGESKTT